MKDLAQFLTEHGLNAIIALLLALLSIWWIEPTTEGGVAFLILIVFSIGFAFLEIIKKLVNTSKHNEK